MSAATASMRALIDELYPVCRSITGAGTRATLDRLGEEIPIERARVASGTPVLDWAVPDEWSIRDAWLAREGSTERLVDFRASNLHVVNYSVPIDTTLPLDDLRPHLHTLADRPGVIPYRTTYYRQDWGLCLEHERLLALADGRYRVVIDSDLRPGWLDWGELTIPGTTGDTVLFSTHICHPSLANDNLSGIAVLAELAKRVAAAPRRYTYRFLFIPGTIGAITWLASRPEVIPTIRHGVVVTGLGDASELTYKQSRRGTAPIDRLVEQLLHERAEGRVVPFSPYGYDERQFCSPGFDLPVGRLTRGVHGEYPEYHTSADDLAFVSDDQLERSLEFLAELVDAIEADRTWRNLSPFGEPQLGRRNLYSAVGGAIDSRSVEMAYLWVLSGSDGSTRLSEIAARSGLPLAAVSAAASRLHDAGLLGDDDR